MPPTKCPTCGEETYQASIPFCLSCFKRYGPLYMDARKILAATEKAREDAVEAVADAYKASGLPWHSDPPHDLIRDALHRFEAKAYKRRHPVNTARHDPEQKKMLRYFDLRLDEDFPSRKGGHPKLIARADIPGSVEATEVVVRLARAEIQRITLGSGQTGAKSKRIMAAQKTASAMVDHLVKLGRQIDSPKNVKHDFRNLLVSRITDRGLAEWLVALLIGYTRHTVRKYCRPLEPGTNPS